MLVSGVNKQNPESGSWESPIFPLCPSCVGHRVTCRSGNHRSLNPGGYCEDLEEKAGCGCQGKATQMSR